MKPLLILLFIVGLIEAQNLGPKRQAALPPQKADIIARGQFLLKEANAALANYQVAPEIYAKALDLVTMIQTMQRNPSPSVSELQKNAKLLTRYERSLQQLMAKLYSNPQCKGNV